ncbi:hypothetical protein DFH06DRAFT_1310313 [Mycena polygramma]|nr:hypothetical protein DFH06DRAFT_1310313 [Mycena polygramma]
MREHQHPNVPMDIANAILQDTATISFVDKQIRIREHGRLVAGYDLPTFVGHVIQAEDGVVEGYPPGRVPNSRRSRHKHYFSLKPLLKSAAEEWVAGDFCIINPPEHTTGAAEIDLGVQGLQWEAQIRGHKTVFRVITNGRLPSDRDFEVLYRSQRKSHDELVDQPMYQICKIGHEKAVAWIINAGEMGFDLVDEEKWESLKNEERTRAKQLLFIGLSILQLLADHKRAPRTGK